MCATNRGAIPSRRASFRFDIGWPQPDQSPLLQKPTTYHGHHVSQGQFMNCPYQNASELGWIVQGRQADVTSTSLRRKNRRGTLVVPAERRSIIRS